MEEGGEMNFLALSVLCAVAALVVAWNFYPPFREKMRGWTTLFEAVIGSGFLLFDGLAETLQADATAWSAVITEDVWPYVTLGVVLWFGAFKRWITTTALGQR